MWKGHLTEKTQMRVEHLVNCKYLSDTEPNKF